MPKEEPEPEESFLRPVADPLLNIGASINDVVKGFTDAFGADNAVSQNLAKNSEWYRSLLSAGAKQDQEEIGRIMQEAEGQGVLAEIGAGLKALTVAPIDLVSQGIGSLIPFIATAGVGKAVGLSKGGIAILQGVQGGAVGGGIVKGEIYSAVKDQLINSGVDEEKAEKAAMEAQSYNGKNLDQILLGVGLGVAASTTGADSAIRSLIARKVGKETAEQVSEQAIQEVLRTGFVRGALKDWTMEFVTEALQGGQERLAANIAVGREGFDVDPMRGVVGQATLEGALGSILGGGAGGISARVAQRDAREVVALRDAQKAAEEAKQSNAPASAAAVEEQINQTLEETPDEKVARLQEEATAAAGIELEEEPPVSGLPPVEPIPPVTPTPEAAVAPVEPVVEPVVAEPQPAVEVATGTKEEQDLRAAQERDRIAKEAVAGVRDLPEDSPEVVAAYTERTASRQNLVRAEVAARHPNSKNISREEEQFLAPLQALAPLRPTEEPLTEGKKWRKGEEVGYNENVGTITKAIPPEGQPNTLYRVVTREDYERILANGQIDSDMRLAITADEGINLTPKTSTATYYLPRGETGVVLAIDPTGLDLNFIQGDSYVRSFKPIPADRIVGRSDFIHKDAETGEYLLRPQDNAPVTNEPTSIINYTKAAPTLEAAPAVTPPVEVAPEVTPTPETPNLEPLRRVARAEQTEEDVSGLVGQGLVELYNGQPVITQAGLEALPEAERPRLNPEARKIQIDTGSNEVVAEAISKNLRIGVDQVPFDVSMPAGWTIEGDIYVPPAPQEVTAEVEQPEATPKTPQIKPITGDLLGQYRLRDDEQFSPVKSVPISDLTGKQYFVDRKLVEDYKKRILAGEPIDPIIAKTDFTVLDGYHRSEALQELGFKELPVTFVEENDAQAREEWAEDYPNQPFPESDFNQESKRYGEWQAGASPAPEVRESRREQPVVLKNRFYSQLERTVAAKMPNVSSPEQLKAIIDPTRGSGVKPEEIKWSGITEAIDRIASENNGRVPKEAIIKYMQDEGRVKFEEVTLARKKVPYTGGEIKKSKDGKYYILSFLGYDNVYTKLEDAKADLQKMQEGMSRTDDATEYSKYQLPNGENYREVVLTIPKTPSSEEMTSIVPSGENIVVRGVAMRWDEAINRYIEKTEGDALIKTLNKFTKQQREDYISRELVPDIRIKLGATREESKKYKSPHFANISNYVAHMRLNDRKDADRKDGTFIEEIQSDLHQKAREVGYKDENIVQQNFASWLNANKKELSEQEIQTQFKTHVGEEIQQWLKDQEVASKNARAVPDAPFRKDWPIQMFKRALEQAVMSGKDWIGWTTGETQASRYDLSKRISKVGFEPNKKGDFSIGELYAYDLDNKLAIRERNIKPEQLADYIGKEAAEKLLQKIEEFKASPQRTGMRPPEISGLDLKVGGEGMAGFYDNILPKEIAKYVKKWGATVEKSFIGKSPSKEFTDAVERFEEAKRLYGAESQQATDAMMAIPSESGGEGVYEIWRVNITPEMRRIIEEEGQSLFSLQMPSRGVGMEPEAVATKIESLGFGRGGIVSVVNEPDASFEGRTIIRDGKVVGIELNAAALKDDAAIERVLNHEIAESANADGALNTLVAGLTPKERKEINDAITRLGYAEKARTAEEAARAVELLAEGWKGRKWFDRAVARVEAWANKLGYKLTRRAAEYIAARNVSEINDSFKQAYNKFITPSSQEGAVIRESIREDIAPDPDINEEGSNAETEAAITQRAEAKKSQELVTGHSILADEVPSELREEAQANYQNGMTLGDFLNPQFFNLGEAYNPYIAATWLELNGGLMPTVKVEGKEIAKPEKGTSEAEALRLLKRASDILDSRSETAGGKELTYSLQDIMATWMESGLGPAALKNAIVQFTNLDVAQADKTANDFARVYELAQNVTATKERARVRMDRALPAVTARQQREKERMIKLEEAAGSIDSIAEAIRIAYDIGIKKPKTDKATEKKQIEEQLRQAKQILRDVVPKQYLGDQLLTLERATGLEGLKKVVEAAQNGLNQARLDEAVAGAKKSLDRAQKAVKANEISPEAMAVLRDFVETYSKKGIGPETRAKIEDAINRYEADPVGALQDLATEKYLKQKGALGAIKIDKSLGLDALKEISRIINTTLHADKVARGEMLFNKQETRQEVITGISEEIDKVKSIAKARKDGGQGIGLFNKVAIYKGARVENILRAFGLNKLSEFVYDRLTLDAYQDELRVRRDLKKKIESRVKEITGLEIGTKDYDLYSKEVVELTGVDSAGRTKPIKVRRYELLDILASMRDPSNLKRAVNSGGYVIDRLDLAEVDTVKITPETYIEILNKATDQDNQMVDMMVDLYNNDLFQVLENASVQAYGHGIKAVSGTYYPRTADKWTRATEVKKDLDYIAYYQRRVDDVGYLKERDERSKSKLRAVDFLERLDYHVTNDARIGAYLPIVRDIEMVLGDPAIARPLASKIGEEGLNMIREMVRQQTTPPAGLKAGILSTLIGNAGVGVLGFKLHAAMQNPVGLPIALAYYGKDGVKYLAKAFPAGIRATKKGDRIEMEKILSQYAPYYNERYGDGGFIQEFTSGLSAAPSNRKWRKNLETASMSWLEASDKWGALVRYKLAQQVVQDRTTLESGTEEFNRAVAREWTKMMFRSENTAHGGDRTGVFQDVGRNPALKLFVMFQSAVSKQYSLFAEAMLRAQQGGKENLREATFQLGFLSLSLYISRAISNAFYSTLFPPEDDEEKTWGQFLGKAIGTPLSIVPVVGSFLQNTTEAIFSPENMRKPMQIDLVSSVLFGMYDVSLLFARAYGELSEEKIDEATGSPKFWETSYRAITKAGGLAGVYFGIPIGGVVQTAQFGLRLKERVGDVFSGEPKTEDFQKKIKEYEKEQRTEPVTQEYAKIFFAVTEDNQKEFNRALKDLKAKRPDLSRKDVINAIRRRPEFRVVGMVRSGKMKQKDLEANGISRDYYLTQKALLRATEEAAKTMYRDSKD
jgi:hypothetical protein